MNKVEEILRKSRAINNNEKATKMVDELLRSGNLTFVEVVELVYSSFFKM